MKKDYEVLCSWCGRENTYSLQMRGETVRVKCAFCGHDYYLYETDYGVVVSPHDEYAWLK